MGWWPIIPRPSGGRYQPLVLIMSSKIINPNDVNGSLATAGALSVTSGKPCCGRQLAGRDQTTDPAGASSDQAPVASGSSRGGAKSKSTGRDRNVVQNLTPPR